MAGLGNFRYNTSGFGNQDTTAIHAAAVEAHGKALAAQAAAQGSVGAAAQNKIGTIGGAQANAVGSANAAMYSGLGNAYAGMYGGLGTAEAGRYSGLAGLAGAMSQDNSNRYGAYAAAEGSRQTAMANEAIGRYGANAQAEVARQTALGNLGSAALGAYGSTANQALQAWTQNQQAYNQALAQMQGAGQNALSAYGVSRNQGLGQLATAYGDAGGRLGAAGAVGDLTASFGGDFGSGGAPGSTMNAYDPYGVAASGSYGAGGGGFSGAVNRSSNNSSIPGVADQTFAGLGGVGQSLMAGDVTAQLGSQYDRSMDDLNAQHYSSRMMPAQMQQQTFGDLLTMGNQYIAPTMAGMDQYYANANVGRPDFSAGMNQFYGNMAQVRPDYSGILEPLTQKTTFTAPKFGAAPTIQSLFGNESVGLSGVMDGHVNQEAARYKPPVAPAKPKPSATSKTQQQWADYTYERTGRKLAPGSAALQSYIKRFSS